ncbi:MULTISPECIES: Rap1a/Tai family immunity protein [unclassified Marinovum]
MRVAILVLAISGSPASAQDGNFLFRQCTNNAVDSKAMCAGFVGGAAGLIPYAPLYSSAVCLPSGVTYPQMVDVVIAFLRNNPARRHEFASPLIARALAEAFPCG